MDPCTAHPFPRCAWCIEQRKSKRKRRAPRLEPFTDEQLAAADAEIKSEAVGIQVMHEEELGDNVSLALYTKAWEAAHADLQYVPSRNAYVPLSQLTEAEELEAQRHELQRLTGFLGKVVRHEGAPAAARVARGPFTHVPARVRSARSVGALTLPTPRLAPLPLASARAVSVQNKRATKLEAKVRVLTAGYEKRAGALAQQLEATCTDADNNTLELACFQRLAHDETAAIPGRLAAAEAEARDVSEREVELQSRYQNLVQERERLLAQLQDASGVATNAAAANGTAIGASA